MFLTFVTDLRIFYILSIHNYSRCFVNGWVKLGLVLCNLNFSNTTHVKIKVNFFCKNK